MTGRLKLELLQTGLPGLDHLIGGGLPSLSLNIIAGEPGSGKTTLAQHLMFSMTGPERRALYFTAQGEPPVKMLRYQQQFSFFDFDKLDTSIRYVNLAEQMQAGDYRKLLNQIVDQVQSFKPALVFIDSFPSIILAAKGEQQQLASLQWFTQQLAIQMAGWQATTFLIGECNVEGRQLNPIFTIADGIFWMTQNVYRNAIVRKMQIVKMRGIAQSPGLHTFRVGRNGIEIFPRVMPPTEAQPLPAPLPFGGERLSTGVATLDQMLGGGVPRGYSVLLVGPSGSGKSLLATEFLAEGVRRGERCIIALFEKSQRQMLNDRLRGMVQHAEVGLLNLHSLDLSVDEMLNELLRMIAETRASRVVFDSLSGFELALAPEFRAEFRESLYRIISTLNSQGVTVLMISELEDRYSELRFSPLGSAFLADVIVMQRYFERAGQLKTLISVVKVRGSAHSRDLRLFEITANGFVIGQEPLPYDATLSGGQLGPEPTCV